MTLSLSTVLVGIVVASALLLALRSDQRLWKRKSREELLALIEGPDWRYWKPALQELRRRGEDIARYAVVPLRGLDAESKFAREAARITLVDLFPEVKAKLKACGYRSIDDPDTCRRKLAAMLMQGE